MDQQEEFEDAQEPPQPPPQETQHHQQPVNLIIPPFWSANPEAWFCKVEGQFILRNTTQDNLLGALPESAVRSLGCTHRLTPTCR